MLQRWGSGKIKMSNTRSLDKSSNDCQPFFDRPDYTIAKQFLDLLAPDGNVKTFQVFDEAKKNRIRPAIFHGELNEHSDHLADLNLRGAGIFATINRTDGKGRKQKNIVGITAVFVDLDGSPLDPARKWKLKPHLIVESSHGKYHLYWFVTPDFPLDKFTPIQKALAAKFNGDPQVCDVSRVMRLPGFYHCKGELFLTRIIHTEPGLPRYTFEEIKKALGIEATTKQGEPAPQQEGILSANILAALTANETGDRWIYVQLHGGKFVYDASAGVWYKWEGHYWTEDITNESLVAVESVAEAYLAEADRQSQLFTEATRGNEKDRAAHHKKTADELAKRVFALRTRKRQENVRHLAAQGSDGLGIVGDEWDSDPWLLGCKNGVVRLRDGSFRPGQPADFIKTVCETEWQGKDAPCTTWDRFISEIIVDENFEPDKETAEYLQRLLGYGVTGLRQEHILPVFWGQGRNGKGTLFEALAHVLGPIARKVPSEILLASARPRDSAQARPDLMDLRGRRLCWCNETNEGRKLDLSLAKELAGGDTISARQLHGKITNFVPSHLLILSTNYAPQIPSIPTDPIWDRLALVPFRLKFVDNPEKATHERQRDKALLDKLKLEAPGILACLVNGAVAWQRDGLNPPENVSNATAAYQESEDVVGQFIEECCEADKNNKTLKAQAGPLHQAYKSWCISEGRNVDNSTRFGLNMKARFEKYRDNKDRRVYYTGIRLRNEPVQEAT
jgi:putative DNA primase/helicase